MTELNSSHSSIDKIVNCLKSGKPRNISEISKLSKLTWDTTKSTLKKLESFNFVFLKEGTNNIYFINPKTVESKTYFNLPIDEYEKNKINQYYYLIQKKWIETTQEVPTRIQVYKVISKLNRNLKLNLPIGLYNYGDCPIVPYNTDFDYSVFGFKFDKITNENVQNIINDYKEIDTPRKLRIFHYNEVDQKAYIAKERILDLLYYSTDCKKNKIDFKLIDLTNQLIEHLVNDKIGNQPIKLAHNFLDILYQFKAREEKLEIDDLREDLIDSFKDLWSLIATHYFKKSFEDKYEPKILEICFENRIREEEEIVLNHYFTLSSILRTTFENPILNKYFQKLNKTKNKSEDITLTKKDLDSEKEQDQELKKIGLD